MKRTNRTTSIQPDPRNARTRDDAGKAAIRRSIEALGAGRSIVTDKDGVIVAGNGVFEQAQALGVKLRIVETDGAELVAVKRTDLLAGDPRRTALALADNQLATLAAWDEPKLAELREGLTKPLDEAAGFGLDSLGDDWSAPPPDGDGSEFDTVSKYGAILRLGEHHCDVTRAEYDQVIEDIRQAVGFDDEAVTVELLRRIGA